MTKVTIEVEDEKIPCAMFPRQLTVDQRSLMSFEMSADKQSVIGHQTKASNVRLEGSLVHNHYSQLSIGVVVNGSDKMTVFPVDAYSIETIIPGVTDGQIEDIQVADGNYGAKRQALIDTYAPAKKRRQAKSTANARVSDEKIVDAEESLSVIRLKAEETVVNQTDAIIAQMREMLPPFNLESASVASVFDLSAIFPDALIAQIDPEQWPVKECVEWIKGGCQTITDKAHPCYEVFSLSTIQRLGGMVVNSKHFKPKPFARFLAICWGLLLLFKERAGYAWKATVPETLHQHISNLYQPQNRLSKQNSYKLLCHLIILILRLTPNWQFDFQTICNDVKALKPQELQPILKFCALTVSGGSHSLQASLEIPIVITPFEEKKKRK